MKRDCTLRILDEVNCVFVGLHPDHSEYFFEKYGVFVPNYFFNPKVKLGVWDGKLRFFHSTGKTFVNLLPEILPQVIGLGYNVRTIDKRDAEYITPDLIDENFFKDRGVVTDSEEPWIIRPYQVELINTLLSHGNGVGIAGTGSGKTSACAAIALSYEKAAKCRSIIIVPDKNLTDQTIREYERFKVDVGQYSGENKDLDHQHVVSTWQALKNNPMIIQQFNVVIVDECHGLRGKVLTELLNTHGKNIPHRFGVTGTIPKEPADELAVRTTVGNVRCTIKAAELIDQGYLAKLHIDIMQLKVDLHKEYEEYLTQLHPGEVPLKYPRFKDTYFPEWSAEKNYLTSEPYRLEWIVDYMELKRNAKKGNILCLVTSIRFGKKLMNKMKNAHFVHGKDKMKARREIYELFKDNDNIVVIATVNIASTGLDIKRIFNLVFIDAGKSFIRTIQMIGRGLRTTHDKQHVHVTDIGSDLRYSRRHIKARTNYYTEARYPYKKRIVDIV